jgi:hypothetical protein
MLGSRKNPKPEKCLKMPQNAHVQSALRWALLGLSESQHCGKNSVNLTENLPMI